MSDLVNELDDLDRLAKAFARAGEYEPVVGADLWKAADAILALSKLVRDSSTRIEQLEAENARLREALQPFADLADEIETCAAEYDKTDAARNPENWLMSCTWEDLRRARAALAGKAGT